MPHAAKTMVTMSEVDEAIDRVMAGPEKKTRVMSERERRMIAYHELGHAIVAHALPNTDGVHWISRHVCCHQNDHTVIAINTATNQRIGEPIAVIKSPVSIAITPDGTKAFVPSGAQAAMSVINPLTLKVIATVKLLGVANRAVVSPDGKKLYVLHGPNHAISVVSTDSLAVTKVVPAPSGPGSMVIHPALPRAWVTFPDRGVVALFDTGRDEFSALETPTGRFARDMAISPDGARVFVGNMQQNTVSVLDTLTLDIVADIPVRRGPVGLEITPDGSSLLVANNFDNSVTIINPFKIQIVAEGIQAGRGSDSFAFIETLPQMEYRAFVSSQTGNTVAVLDLQTGNSLALVAVGKAPRMVAITPDQKRVCVCNSEDATLTIIDAVTYSVIGSPVPVVKLPISIGHVTGRQQGIYRERRANNVGRQFNRLDDVGDDNASRTSGRDRLVA